MARETEEMAEHKPGQMDVREHERTFWGFVTAITYGVVAIAITLLFLALVNS
ncbi:MAG TPA: aa3-type cytochrome c oxidase subunit IV [Paracoccaceae bacterium]|nr:aa3-type cytochrome c oxidase subunit IV [Paracoccaceae bacterium]